jgi:hypothetical protein
MPPKYTMSESESEAEDQCHAPSAPSDEALEQSLRDIVAAIFKSGNMDELTVKRVRLAAESSLGLTAGYFKSTDVWKMRSEEIIKDEVVSLHYQLGLRGKETDCNVDLGNTRPGSAESTVHTHQAIIFSSPKAQASYSCEEIKGRERAKAQEASKD